MPANRLDPMSLNDFLETTYRVSDLSAKSPEATFTMNTVMVRLIISLDGKMPMKNIARAMNMSGEQLRGNADKLFNHELIEKVATRSNVLDVAFYKNLSTAMARIVGPIAPILIDDAIAGLGYQRSSFPVKRVAELINSLSMEIQQKDKRLAFQKYMINQLKEKKYLRL